jgi:Glu-tRNA(Gln) amidotransferase subunit E-like FAD-binding protein
VARAIGRGKAAKEAAFDLGFLVGTGRAKDIDGAVASLGLKSMSKAELEREIDRVLSEDAALVKEKGEAAFSVLMGRVMQQARGRADGEAVSRLLREKLKAASRS